MPATDSSLRLLPFSQWRILREQHRATVQELTTAHLERRQTGKPHPVIDFLFTYYRSSVGRLRQWHPGPGYALALPAPPKQVPRYYRLTKISGTPALTVDLEAARADAGTRWQRAANLLAATASREPHLGCFGLHEWAMVYRLPAEKIRHNKVPLRVSQATIEKVLSGGVQCTHFDAFRFFTDAAVPLNTRFLSRDTQIENEQPGCLHAGMDLYRWASELGAACPSSLHLRTFQAALSAREIDMRASPYDLRAYGYAPIPIETASGRASYVAEQRRCADVAARLREELLELYQTLGVRNLQSS